MGRYVYLPMEYKDYLNKFINTLKTGELLVNLEEHDIYVTEEGINIPIPVISPLRNEVINFLDTDLEGIKLKMQLTPQRIENLFKQKSEMDEIQQNIYSRIVKLKSQNRDVKNRHLYVTRINEYNVNRLGDLSLNLDAYDDSIKEYIKDLTELKNLFNYYNSDCRSLYEKNFKNRNDELIRIWNEITKLFELVNKKLVKLGQASGYAEIQKAYVSEGYIYDVEWNRRLHNLETYYGRGVASNENSYMNLVNAALNSGSINFTKFMEGSSMGTSLNIYKYNRRTGSNICYPNFASKINLIDEYHNDLKGSTYGTQLGAKYDDWNCAELPPVSIGHSIGSFNYVISPVNRLIPFYWGSTNDKEKHWSQYAGNKDLIARTGSDGFANSYNASCTLSKDAYYTGNIATQAQCKIDSNKVLTFDLKSSLYKTKSGSQLEPVNKSGFSPTLPSRPFVVRNIKFLEAYSGVKNTDCFVFRVGVQKRFNETKMSKLIKLNYDNDKGWIRS